MFVAVILLCLAAFCSAQPNGTLLLGVRFDGTGGPFTYRAFVGGQCLQIDSGGTTRVCGNSILPVSLSAIPLVNNYNNGDQCPNGKRRDASLTISCGATRGIYSVVENPTCTYTLHAYAPELCTWFGTVTATPSISPSISNTPSNTPSLTRSPSNTPSKTGTRTQTASITASRTNTRTTSPTRTATRTRTGTPTVTRTATATKTSSRTVCPSPTNTRTPSPSRTPSRTASGTATQSASQSATATQSRSQTSTPSTSRTPSPTVTSTQTSTETPSITPTTTSTGSATGTPTATGTFTPSNTATATTNTVTGTSTGSATSTATPSSTASRTMTPSKTPLPLRILNTVYTVDTNRGVGVIRLIGQGFRLYEASAAPTIHADTFTVLAYREIDESTVEFDIPLGAYYWAYEMTTFAVVAGHSDSFLKLPQPLVPPDIGVSPSIAKYPQRIRVHGPYITQQPLKGITLQSTNGMLNTSCVDIRSESRDEVSCIPAGIAEPSFDMQLRVRLQFVGNQADVMLASVTVTIRKPSMEFLLRNITTARAPLTNAVHVSIPVPARVTAARGWLQRRFGPLQSQSLQLNGLAAPVHRLHLPAAAPAVRMKPQLFVKAPAIINTSAPIVHAVTPQTIPMPSNNHSFTTRFITVQLMGQAFGSSQHPRLLSGHLGPLHCSISVINSTQAACTLHSSDVYTLANTAGQQPFITYPLTVRWGTATDPRELHSALSVRFVMATTVSRVMPATVEPEDVLILVGKHFTYGAAQRGTIKIGGVSCRSTAIVSAEVATCVVPVVPVTVPGYPRVSVVLDNAENQTTMVPLQISLASEVTVNWAPWQQPLCVLPSSSLLVIPMFAAPTLVASGFGSVRCDVEAVSSDTRSVALNGRVSLSITVGSDGGSVSRQFTSVGVTAASGSSGQMRGSCVASDGTRLALNTTNAFYTPPWSVAWAVRPPRASILRPTDEVAGSAVFRVSGCMFGNATLNLVPQYLSCTSSIKAMGNQYTVTTGAVVTPMETSTPGSTDFSVVFDPLQLWNFALGSTLTHTASCTWTPSGETLQLPAAELSIADVSVSWDRNFGERNSRQQLQDIVLVYPGLTYNTNVSITANANAFTNDVIACTISVVESQGIEIDPNSAVSLATPLHASVRWTPTLRFGGDSGYIDALVECSVWGKSISSSRVRIEALQVSLTPLTPLPMHFITSTSRTPVAHLPEFSFLVVADGLDAHSDIECVLSTLSRVMQVHLGDAGENVSLQPNNGVVNVSTAVVVAMTSADRETEIQLQLLCSFPGLLIPAAYTWSVSQIPLLLEVEIVTSPTTDTANNIPTFSAALRPTNTHLSEAWLGFLWKEGMRNAVVCTVRPQARPDGTAAFLYRSSNTVDERGVATFARVALTGLRGNDYNFTVACQLDWLELATSQTFTVTHLRCPAGSAPVGITCETCPPQTFTRGMNEPTCIACPKRGARCEAGLLFLLPSMYRPPTDVNEPFGPDTELHPCRNPEACIVNTTSFTHTCSAGYTGVLCADCNEELGYGAFGSYCQKCWPEEVNTFILFLLILIVIASVGFIASRDNSARKSESQVALRIAMGYIQALASISTLKASVAANYDAVLGWSQDVSDSPFMVGPAQCVLRWNLPQRFTMTTLMPIIAFGIAIALVSMFAVVRALNIRACSFRREVVKHHISLWFDRYRHISVLVFFAVFMYMPIIKLCMTVITCTTETIGGDYRVTLDLNMQCGSTQHVSLRIAAVFILIVYGFGFPVGLFYLFAKSEYLKTRPGLVAALSFLHGGYRTPYDGVASSRNLMWWESAVLLRKAGLVLIVVLVTNTFSQVVASILWLSFFLVLQQHYRPYTFELFNALETVVLFVLFITASMAGIMIPTSYTQQEQGGKPDKTLAAIASLLLAANMILGITLVASVIYYTVRSNRLAKSVHQLVSAKLSRRNLITDPGMDSSKQGDVPSTDPNSFAFQSGINPLAGSRKMSMAHISMPPPPSSGNHSAKATIHSGGNAHVNSSPKLSGSVVRFANLPGPPQSIPTQHSPRQPVRVISSASTLALSLSLPPPPPLPTSINGAPLPPPPARLASLRPPQSTSPPEKSQSHSAIALPSSASILTLGGTTSDLEKFRYAARNAPVIGGRRRAPTGTKKA